MKLRVGMGFDVHPLEEGRNFYLVECSFRLRPKAPLVIPMRMC